jgi:hypothetical protein
VKLVLSPKEMNTRLEVLDNGVLTGIIEPGRKQACIKGRLKNTAYLEVS